MSCDIANGRLEACKDAISGLLNIYFINYGDLNTLQSSVTFDGDDQITEWITATQISLYKYELKGANGFEQTIQTSRDNGTTFFEQVLTIRRVLSNTELFESARTYDLDLASEKVIAAGWEFVSAEYETV